MPKPSTEIQEATAILEFIEEKKEEARIASKLFMGDGLENVVTGMGGDHDKTTHNRWVRDATKNHDYQQLSTRYREDWVAQKVCKIIPQDTTRKWRNFKGDKEAQQADQQFKIANLFRMGQQWANVYGTSFLLLDIKRSGKMNTPLDMKRLRPNCIRSLQVIDRTRMFGTGDIEQDPLSPNYGLPRYYMVGGSTQRIHASRLIRFEATELTRYDLWQNNWHSDSAIVPLMDVIDNFHVAANAAATLCQEATVDVVTVEGLQQLLTNPAGEAAVMKRFRVMKTMKSINNVLLLDSTESYDTKTVALNGVKDLIWEYLRIIAAAVGIPATRFLSASPDGMNATGESDLNNYIDLLTGFQTNQYEPRLEIIDPILQAHFGLPEWEYEWECIFPESALQKAERESKVVEDIVKLVEAFVVTASDAQKLLQHQKVYKDFVFETPPTPPQPSTGDSNAKKN
jgi:phage-related protein (TIGR01555 family)